jgi:hypothetical protein
MRLFPEKPAIASMTRRWRHVNQGARPRDLAGEIGDRFDRDRIRDASRHHPRERLDRFEVDQPNSDKSCLSILIKKED